MKQPRTGESEESGGVLTGDPRGRKKLFLEDSGVNGEMRCEKSDIC